MAIAERRQPLEHHLGWLLGQASFALGSELKSALAGSGITPRDHFVLEAALAGDHTQSEIAEAVGLDKTTMVVTMDELESQGLAERVPAEHDRRVRVIRVTPAGRKKVKQGQAVMQRVQEDVLAALEPAEREAFVAALATLVHTRLAEPAGCAAPQRRKQPRSM